MRTKISLTLILFIFTLHVCKSQNTSGVDPQVKYVDVYKTIWEFSQTDSTGKVNHYSYVVNAITIYTTEAFYEGAYYWGISVVNDSNSAGFIARDELKKSDNIHRDERLYTLTCYFTTDAFYVFKNQYVDIYFGYSAYNIGLHNQLAIKYFNIFERIRPLDPLNTNMNTPEFTSSVYKRLRRY